MTARSAQESNSYNCHNNYLIVRAALCYILVYNFYFQYLNDNDVKIILLLTTPKLIDDKHCRYQKVD